MGGTSVLIDCRHGSVAGGGDKATGHGGAVRERRAGGDGAEPAQGVSAVVAVVAAV